MFSVLGYSLLAGVGGTGLGGLLSVFLGKGKKTIGVLFCLTVGVMLSIVCFELIPEAYAVLDVLPLAIGVILGGVFVYFCELLVEKNKFTKNMGSGFIIALAIALHNFPEGMIVGTGLTSGSGKTLSVLIALHDIPEGMAVALPFVNEGGNKIKGVLIALLSGIPTVLGALLGYYVSTLSALSCAISLAFSAGAMIFVVFSELIPDAKDLYPNEFSAIIVILGILLGLIITEIA